MRLISVIASVLVLVGCGQSLATITINQTVFEVYVADEPAEQELGLGAVQSLEADQGMVFIFSDSQPRSFWMKEVEYPIDIIWVNDLQVIGYVTAQPERTGTAVSDYLVYRSPDSVNMVIEVPAGTVQSVQIEVGDNVLLDE